MQTNTASPDFTRWVHKALSSLYDPFVLGTSPLLDLLIPDRRGDRASVLQRLLIDAIESLQPDKTTPVGSRSWRVYQILRSRYTEQLPQSRVATDLGLSIRQLQREEALARNVLADHLWTLYTADVVKAQSDDAGQAADQTPETPQQPMDSQMRELAALAGAIPVKMTDVESVLASVLKTIEPLAESKGVKLDHRLAMVAVRIPIQGPILRQALVDILSNAIVHSHGEIVRVRSEVVGGHLLIHIEAVAQQPVMCQLPGQAMDDLALAEKLITMCHGSLKVTTTENATPSPTPAGYVLLRATISFPLTEQIPVMVVDDNSDTLKLFEHYLAGSRYRFVGVQDAQRALSLALKMQPHAVVLDVMMPDEDGWTLLSRLREHPKTREIPVIVCTIMSQKELALALGAAEFMRKPVTRADLLQVLDRHVDRSATVAHRET